MGPTLRSDPAAHLPSPNSHSCPGGECKASAGCFSCLLTIDTDLERAGDQAVETRRRRNRTRKGGRMQGMAGVAHPAKQSCNNSLPAVESLTTAYQEERGSW